MTKNGDYVNQNYDLARERTSFTTIEKNGRKLGKALYSKPLTPVHKPVQNVYNFSHKESFNFFIVNYLRQNPSNFLMQNAKYRPFDLQQALQIVCA